MNFNSEMSNDSTTPFHISNSDSSLGASNMLASRQYLEPTGRDAINEFLKVNDNKKGSKFPTIQHVGPSKLLDQVKSFLPQLEAAEMSLQARVDAGENVDVENLDEDNPHIEMNFGFNEIDKSNSGSSDSEPDSPTSPAERDNSYTSDSDVDTSSSTSSCSCKSVDCPSTRSKDTGHCIKRQPFTSPTTGNMQQLDEDKKHKQSVIDITLKGSHKSKRQHPLIEDITDSKINTKEPNQVSHEEKKIKKKAKSEDELISSSTILHISQ